MEQQLQGNTASESVCNFQPDSPSGAILQTQRDCFTGLMLRLGKGCAESLQFVRRE